MKRTYLLVFLASMLPGLALGQTATSYECSFENLQRRIEILTEPGVSVPCEVHYYKDSEMPGQKQVLWTATTEAGYCELKTEEFVSKLREWGWACEAGTAAEPDAETEATEEAAPAEDDTEALEPAD
jgi:hypothetical protein